MARKVTRREFLNTAAGTTAIITASRVGHSASAARPNVLFILADDLGYGDLSCYGRPDYRTPVLDHLARQGMKFTSAYAAAPVCTPTRCAFVTGRYPQRLGEPRRETRHAWEIGSTSRSPATNIYSICRSIPAKRTTCEQRAPKHLSGPGISILHGTHACYRSSSSHRQAT